MELLIILITSIIIIFAIQTLLGRKQRYFFTYNGALYTLSKGTRFALLCIISAFLFGSITSGNIRLLTFGLLVLIYLFLKRNVFLTNLSINILFFLFFGWLIVTLFYSEDLTKGGLMLLKYFIPFMFMLFAYNSLSSKEDYLSFLIYANKIILIYICFCWLKLVYPQLSIFYASANIVAALSLVPIALYVIFKNKKNLYHAVIYFLPGFLLIRRAALGAMALSDSIYLFIRYKLKSIFIILFFFIIAIIIVFNDQNIKERVFGGDKQSTNITYEELFNDNILDNINTSGRSGMWEIVMDKFYKNHEMVGSGLGTMKHFLESELNSNRSAFLIIHNDYIHLLCETGWIGLSLWILYILNIFRILITSFKKSKDIIIKNGNLVAIGSLTATSFNMYFDNIVSTTSTFILPFILIGFAMKLNHLQ